jgi:hypothetical protein
MTLEDLGRRAVACKHWRWMEGMQVEPLRFRVVWLTEDMIGESDQTSYFWKNVPDIFPDLSDPATLGCLLALVEEAWKCPVDMSFAGACRLDVDAEERVYPQDHTVSFAAKTRVEALVAALEAAP